MAQMINLGRTPGRYLRLMHHLQNGLPGVYRVMFSDVETARNASKQIKAILDRHPTWFDLVVMQRGCDIYVIKNHVVKKVVIGDDCP